MPGGLFCAAGPAQAPRIGAGRRAARGLLAAATLVPGCDADPIGGTGRTDRLLEVHVVESTHVTGDEPHALGDDLTLRIQFLHEQPRAAVARHAAVRDHASYAERPPLVVLRRFPLQRDGAGVALDGEAIGVRRLCTHPATAPQFESPEQPTGRRRTCPRMRW